MVETTEENRPEMEISTAKEIGQRIRTIRRRLKMNQTEFGQHLGVNTTTMSGYEKGYVKAMQPEKLRTIAELGGITLDELITGQEIPDQSPQTKKNHSDQIDMVKMVTMTMEVLESITIFPAALAANIRAFHAAYKTECEMNDLMGEMKKMQEQMVELKMLLHELTVKDGQKAKKRESYANH